MITKTDAVKALNEKGFDAHEIDGSVEICTADCKDLDRMRKVLKKIGYNGSYGWKMKHEKE